MSEISLESKSQQALDLSMGHQAYPTFQPRVPSPNTPLKPRHSEDPDQVETTARTPPETQGCRGAHGEVHTDAPFASSSCAGVARSRTSVRGCIALVA